MKQKQMVMLATVFVVCAAPAASAQLPRTRGPGGDAAPAEGAIPRDPKFPYAGLWGGQRTIDVHADPLRLRFSVVDGKYAGEMVHRDGSTAREQNLVATAAGLTWESPNSGGGTWVYQVHLAAPDSLVGTLVLRDPPPNLMPAPTGTLVMTRQRPSDARER